MKLKVLIPSEEYKNYAGARIRYGRLQAELGGKGIELLLENVAEFSAESDDFDALLISKCHDARALVAAAVAYGRGKLVGVDLFDDYFSQTADSRLSRYRHWLRQLLRTCHFALCSTAVLRDIVESYSPGVPVHVVNDPAPEMDMKKLSERLAAKLVRARDQQLIRLGWFGVGDNPHFKVGLSDLAAYGGQLRELSGRGMDVELTVLTNARALTAEGLALVREVPLRTRVEEWTEEGERKLLDEAFACFLPVNAQPFSVAKSLNRAISALSAGCQVISAGYPLYEPFADFVYRGTGPFLDDLKNRSLRHSVAHIEKYRAVIQKLASSVNEAEALAKFLRELAPACVEDSRPIVLVQGQAASGASHKAVRAAGGFSVGSPYCAAEFGFDVAFPICHRQPLMLLSDQAVKRIDAALRSTLQPARIKFNRKLWKVGEENLPGSDSIAADEQWHAAPLAFRLATYESTMNHVADRMERTFGACRVVISESSTVPFSFGLGR